MGSEGAGVSGAILGFYGAIKLCRREGHNPETVFRLVLDFLSQTETQR